ncbi:aspartyl protease family protein At5g10770-like isoform X2 [Rhodamnia argentea]|uniref:Aspartyl protease family protein At5g10770-like isoform X2 n=1 Tax=Rhodamnia argentea TaxID=178133 RepID=A0ABM3HDU4_9MYRT|nr:aspartyl protease family protein At5g10770-like isoform X2 [Rhodamnia argentea]
MCMGRKMVNREGDDKYVVELKSLTPPTTCKGQVNGRGLTLAHRQGPCSPLAANRQSRNSKVIFRRDQSRVRSMNILGQPSMPTSGDYGENAQLPIRGATPGAGEYVVTIGLGTPKVDLTLIFDTSSDITWTQCEPCLSCYRQQDPMFDPSKSSTYSNPPCKESDCPYSIVYADGSQSNGYYVQDLLTLTPEYQFPDFIFGCSQNNSGDFGRTAGMLGLGQGGATFISHVASKFSNIFCYCIPGSESSNGYLLFGMEALSNCQTNNITPLIIDQNNPSFYFVNLVGIAFGNQKFSLSSQSPPPRTIIDSGTTITRLPPPIYSAIRSEFVRYMSSYPATKPASTLVNTCYDLRGQENVILPKMVLQFENTDVSLDPSAVVWRESDAQVCLAVAPSRRSSNLVIIGNVQQRNLKILYNIQDNKVEFGNGGCDA